MNRMQIGALTASASLLVSVALWEGFRGEAYVPVEGDVPTIGFGTTKDVKRGDKITVERALVQLLADATKFEQAVKKCAPVPMHQYEFDAFVSLTYNIGEGAFCNSTLVKYLNEGNYEMACKEILKWNKFRGKELKGLTLRRQTEYLKCIGQ